MFERHRFQGQVRYGSPYRRSKQWEKCHMQQQHRITLWLIVLWFVVGFQPGAQAQSPEKLVFALHVSISPSWFDPAETPAQITPFGILYALHDAVVRPLPGERMAPA